MADYEKSREDEDKMRGEAERQVDAFLGVLTRRLGVPESELPDLIHAIRTVSKHEKLLQRVLAGGLIAAIGSALAFFAALIWDGVRARLGLP